MNGAPTWLVALVAVTAAGGLAWLQWLVLKRVVGRPNEWVTTSVVGSTRHGLAAIVHTRSISGSCTTSICTRTPRGSDDSWSSRTVIPRAGGSEVGAASGTVVPVRTG